MHKKFLRTLTTVAVAPALGLCLLVTQARSMEDLDGQTCKLRYNPKSAWLRPGSGIYNTQLPSADTTGGPETIYRVSWDKNRKGATLQSNQTSDYLTACSDRSTASDRSAHGGLWFMTLTDRDSGRIHHSIYGTSYSLEASDPSSHGGFSVRLKPTSNDPNGQSWTLVPATATDEHCTIN